MDSRLLFVVCVTLYCTNGALGSSIAERKATDKAEGETNKNFKRQFVVYPNEEVFGHHHRHHHHFHDGFFDGYHGGEGMGYDSYHDHGNIEEMDVPQYEHVHHQYKHIHHVSKYALQFIFAIYNESSFISRYFSFC